MATVKRWQIMHGVFLRGQMLGHIITEKFFKKIWACCEIKTFVYFSFCAYLFPLNFNLCSCDGRRTSSPECFCVTENEVVGAPPTRETGAKIGNSIHCLHKKSN